MIPEKLILQDRQAMNRTATIASNVVSDNLPDLSALSQQGAGGVMRSLATNTMLSVGGVATAAAVASYGQLSAAAGLEFEPETIDVASEVLPLVDVAVGRSMSAYSQGLFAEAASFLAATVGRNVANVYRTTMAVNASNDRNALGYKRIAGPGACAFCAFAATAADITTNENVEFHDHCSCSTVPVFKDVSYWQPDFYSDYQDDSDAAMTSIRARDKVDRAAWNKENPRGKDKQYFAAYPQNAMVTKNILAEMRATGRYK